MAGKIIWSLQAREDLRDIVTFIATDNPAAAAQSFGFRLMSKVDVLANFPQLGRVVPEENDETIRELILRPFASFIRCWQTERPWPSFASGTVHEANRKFRAV
jgi:toxin ParE1/3/4